MKAGERLFFASTSEVYAGGVDLGVVGVPTAEDVPVLVTDPSAPRFSYAISRLLGEAAVAYAEANIGGLAGASGGRSREEGLRRTYEWYRDHH